MTARRRSTLATAVIVAVSAWVALGCSGDGDAPAPATQQPGATPAAALSPLADALLTAADAGEGFMAEGAPTCLAPELVELAGHGLVRSCAAGVVNTKTEGLHAVRTQMFAYSTEEEAAAFLGAINEDFLFKTFRSSLRDFSPGPALPIEVPLESADSVSFIMKVNAPSPETQTNGSAFILVFQQGRYAGEIIYEAYLRPSPADMEMRRLAQLMVARIDALPESVLTPEPVPTTQPTPAPTATPATP